MQNTGILLYIYIGTREAETSSSSKHIYRWREVSTSEVSKFLDVGDPWGHKLEEGGGFVFMVLWSPCVEKLRPRERESWRIGLCRGGIILGCCCCWCCCWEFCDEGFCIIDDEVFSDDKSLRSCLPSLLSLTFSNCLNLSWRRAMEEFTVVVGSLACLPIWQWVKNEVGVFFIFWWGLAWSGLEVVYNTRECMYRR